MKLGIRPANGSSWRHTQARWKQRAARIKAIRILAIVSAVALLLTSGYLLISKQPSPEPSGPDQRPGIETTAEPDSGLPEASFISYKSISRLISEQGLANRLVSQLDLLIDHKPHRLKTSLDMELQSYLMKRLDRTYARFIAIAALDPEDGRILALVGFSKAQNNDHPSLRTFPAASIFKIVTAAAAVETCGLSPETLLKYNGGKHTLYKSQLTRRTHRYTNRISLKKAFAQSVNPVFGKLGTQCLGKETLETYARDFGFNAPLNSDIPLAPSRMTLTDDTYQWAEIACGFNRQTVISPVHGALLAASIIRGGSMPAPTLIDQIRDDKDRVVYARQGQLLNRAMAPETAEMMKSLMVETLISGTGRKVFRGHRKDRVLKRLDMGGKTGSIDNQTEDARLDWFVGFARTHGGHKQLSIAVLVAHEKYLGTRAIEYGKLAFKNYFSTYFKHQRAANRQHSNTK